jgi:hypothetical protein
VNSEYVVTVRPRAVVQVVAIVLATVMLVLEAGPVLVWAFVSLLAIPLPVLIGARVAGRSRRSRSAARSRSWSTTGATAAGRRESAVARS